MFVLISFSCRVLKAPLIFSLEFDLFNIHIRLITSRLSLEALQGNGKVFAVLDNGIICSYNQIQYYNINTVTF